MASVFRRRITRKILSALKPFIGKEDVSNLYSLIPLSTKLRKAENGKPVFELHWKELIKLKPDLENRIHPESLCTCLKNQDFLPPEGITDVTMEVSPHQKYLFSVDQWMFHSSVLLETNNHIEELIDKSCFFKNIPPENVIVEFSSPNIAKPFHYGHFRSTVIGNFLTNLFKYIGHRVTTINYIGDWGLQYGILATGFKQFGSEEKLKADPLSHLHEVYIQANVKNTEDPKFNVSAKQHFQDMEKGNPELLQQWNFFRDLSLKKMNETYERLGIHFDEIHGESMYVQKTNDVFEELIKKNVAFSESDGSLQAPFPENNEEKIILRKSDGTTLYLSRDIAAAIDRQKTFHFDSMYYVVDSSQSKHFSELISILKAMGYSWYDQIHHVSYGRISNFSSRKGNAVFLRDILDEAKDRTLERMKNSPTSKETADDEKTADVLGISALIINDFYARRKREYGFSWDRVLSMKADSGITLQYCHARLNSLKENSGVKLTLKSDLSYLIEPEACSLVFAIARFDEALFRAYNELEPFILVQYLFNLRKAVNRANKVLTVKGQPLPLAKARLVLFHSAQLVLHKGLQILGIKPLERM